ncbi:hypothetical protein BVC93_12560 [Mycobacterium sp. MS1601]|nr:hypothetical protein BVC93_12560 [Mycobacterium sp. MS1601]
MGKSIFGLGVTIYIVAFIVIIGDGGQIRYTADSNGTVPFWHPLLPAIIGVALAMLVPPSSRIEPRPRGSAGTLRIEAAVLLALGLAFTVLLTLLGADEPRYTLLKVTLLLVLPAMLFAVTTRRAKAKSCQPISLEEGDLDGTRMLALQNLWRPLVPAAGWAGCFFILSANRPSTSPELDPTTLLVVLIGGFLLNAVLEEFFYRRWLQTRWQQLLGGLWPAIVLSSVVWASWHIAIQGQGPLVSDLANAIANQGVTGLFLGLLWARYRAMWPLLVLHGVMNANPITMLQGL